MKKVASPLGIISIVAAFAFVMTLTLHPATVYAQAKKEKAKKELVNLNTASEKELEALKGIGPATAKKIIENRPYKSVDELSKAGLSAKTIKDLKPLVTVGPAVAEPAKPAEAAPSKVAEPKAAPKKVAAAEKAKPAAVEKAKPAAEKPKVTAKLAPGQKVNINTATKEQLEALPEIGPVKAQAIIDGRPYQKPEDIMKVKGIKEGTYSQIKDHITVR